VGEMTLKQFAKAAGGVILALLINSTKLVFFIKWPLMIIIGGAGLALAFVPIQDRPLETWLAAFLRSIYSPTIFFYKKKRPANWLDIDLTKPIKNTVTEEELVLPQKEEKKVREFIDSLPSVGRENQNLINDQDTNLKEQTITNNQETIKKTEEKTKLVEEKEEIKKEDIAPANLNLKTEKLGATGTAVFGEIPMPDIPDLPNIVVGMVVDENKKIVEGAIVEIQDKEGNPSRVLKTNKLGQFRTLTQMGNGKYLVVTEKDGFDFDRVEIELEGKIIEPIRIIAK
jgi:hypothetical protein